MINNGNSKNSPLIGKYCGAANEKTAPPAVIVSIHNSLYLMFESDDMVTDLGFVFNWDSAVSSCGAEIKVNKILISQYQ